MRWTWFDTFSLALGLVFLIGLACLLVGIASALARSGSRWFRAFATVLAFDPFSRTNPANDLKGARLLRTAAVCGVVFALLQIGCLVAAYIAGRSI